MSDASTAQDLGTVDNPFGDEDVQSGVVGQPAPTEPAVTTSATEDIRFIPDIPKPTRRRRAGGARSVWEGRLTRMAQTPGAWAIFGPVKSGSGGQSAAKAARKLGIAIEKRKVGASDLTDEAIAQDIAAGKITPENRSSMFYTAIRVVG